MEKTFLVPDALMSLVEVSGAIKKGDRDEEKGKEEGAIEHVGEDKAKGGEVIENPPVQPANTEDASMGLELAAGAKDDAEKGEAKEGKKGKDKEKEKHAARDAGKVGESSENISAQFAAYGRIGVPHVLNKFPSFPCQVTLLPTQDANK